mmetsp:Transcript_4190/g.5502  ORF Transcript_4190/g.5502 Transcript_4190/m.5502 type:complete len:456 (+) Transcript_4190:159-1526(+)
MKVKALKRSSGASVERECAGDLRRHARNLNPSFHPMQRAREYTRAITAAKMERMFAQPLVGNLGNGHRDSVTCTATSRRALLPLVSGCADGCVSLWDLATRKCLSEIPAHSRTVTGVSFALGGQAFYSCSDEGLLHRWSLHPNDEKDGVPTHAPVATWRCNGSFKSIDQSWTDANRFATASDEAVQIWSPERSNALQTHSDLFGSQDTVTTVRWHPVEGHLLAHCSADRGVGLHDIRANQALKKTVLRMRSNDLQWNPMEPMNFAVANEDYQCYLFDMRKLDSPVRMYKGHTSAVLSLAWSPTGREFASGSYDKTVRIFPLVSGNSREVYHTKRMQRIQTVQYTSDNKFIITGSDDSNLRLWKAVANEQLGQLTAREERSMNYRSALVERYKHLPEVKKIHKSRKLPRTIRNQTKQAVIIKESADRKQANRVKYDRKGKHEFTAERKKVVVKEIE